MSMFILKNMYLLINLFLINVLEFPNKLLEPFDDYFFPHKTPRKYS